MQYRYKGEDVATCKMQCGLRSLLVMAGAWDTKDGAKQWETLEWRCLSEHRMDRNKSFYDKYSCFWFITEWQEDIFANNKLQNTWQKLYQLSPNCMLGKVAHCIQMKSSAAERWRLVIFIPPTVSIRSRSLKTARSERQSGVAWVSAEGKRQVRVS